MAIMGHQIGAELCRALNLPKNTLEFTLRCRAGEVVTVECEYWPEGSGSDIVSALSTYELVPRAKTEHFPAQDLAIDFDKWMSGRIESAHLAFMAHNVGRDYSRRA